MRSRIEITAELGMHTWGDEGLANLHRLILTLLGNEHTSDAESPMLLSVVQRTSNARQFNC